MKLRLLSKLFIAISFLASCTNFNSDETKNNDTSTENIDPVINYDYHEDYSKILEYFVNPDYDTTIVQIVEQESAILIYPTSKQIDYLKEKNGEDEFYTVADDNNYYMSNIITLLESLEIDMHTATKRNITFKGLIEDYGMNLDPNRQGVDTIYWSIIVFNPKGNPFFLDMVDPDIDKLKHYMNKN